MRGGINLLVYKDSSAPLGMTMRARLLNRLRMTVIYVKNFH